jgi:hypothetical protein
VTKRDVERFAFGYLHRVPSRCLIDSSASSLRGNPADDCNETEVGVKEHNGIKKERKKEKKGGGRRDLHMVLPASTFRVRIKYVF